MQSTDLRETPPRRGEAPGPAPTRDGEVRVPGRVVVVAFAVAAALALGVMALIWMHRPARPALPVLSTIEPFHLVDQRSRPVALADLAGKVWVADFIFTSCPSVCPKLTARMHELQEKLAGAERREGHDRGVRLVSFSVDPENDTPARLLEYAKQYGADESRWSFLTGPLDEMTRAIEKGMKIPFERTGPTAMEIMHGERFVAVDRAGRIRGYYDVQRGVGPALAAVEDLLREKAP